MTKFGYSNLNTIGTVNVINIGIISKIVAFVFTWRAFKNLSDDKPP